MAASCALCGQTLRMYLVPGLAGGDHGMQMAQDRGSDDALRLGWLELVVLPRGQVPISGRVDGVRALSALDCAPCGEP